MTTTTAVAAIAPIDHREAMTLATNEASRLLAVVDRLDGPDWSRATDCEGWDVKALLSHVLGGMEANARVREFVGQFRAASRAAKRTGRPMIDEMTAGHVRSHESLSPADIARRMHDLAPRAVRGRSRMPAVLRAMPITPGAPFDGRWKLGYLVDTILNRDNWMHRVDLTRATGTELVLTADHDGRIVADVVAEWARAHAQPFTLILDGPAGGTFAQGERGKAIQLDAVDFCRILSGRSRGSGLLEQEVPF